MLVPSHCSDWQCILISFSCQLLAEILENWKEGEADKCWIGLESWTVINCWGPRQRDCFRCWRGGSGVCICPEKLLLLRVTNTVMFLYIRTSVLEFLFSSCPSRESKGLLLYTVWSCCGAWLQHTELCYSTQPFPIVSSALPQVLHCWTTSCPCIQEKKKVVWLTCHPGWVTGFAREVAAGDFLPLGWAGS